MVTIYQNEDMTMGGDTYVNVTVYRGGTLDNPTLPLVIDDLEYVSVKQ